MKKQFILTFISAFLMASIAGFARMNNDTTIVEFNDKGVKKRITVLTNGDKKFSIPKILNLDNLLKEIGVDSAQRRKAGVFIERDGGEKDTVLVIAQDGRSVKIVAKNPFPHAEMESDTLQVPEDEEEMEVWDEEATEQPEENENEEEVVVDLRKKKYFSRSDFGLYLGLNGWSNNSTNNPNQMTELRASKSRYVALSFRKNATFVNTEKTDIALSFGPEIAWYNFMLQNNAVATETRGQVMFGESPIELTKSKLVMPYLNFPVLLNFGFEQAKINFGIGGYVGYRVGGYTKTKDARGDKEHQKAGYGMNDIFYGLTTELGKKNGFTMFFRYDLNKMFKANQLNASELQAWSVGFRL